MVLECLPMGCLSSRPSTVSPHIEPGQANTSRVAPKGIQGARVGGKQNGLTNGTQVAPNNNQEDGDVAKQLVDVGTSFDRESGVNLTGSHQEQDDNSNGNNMSTAVNTSIPASPARGNQLEREDTFDAEGASKDDGENKIDLNEQADGTVALVDNNNNNNNKSIDSDAQDKSFDGEDLNMDLLRQYIAIDFEITQLEDRNALRLYHERIEQLEQLERELDMISLEAEEAANRSEIDMSQIDRIHSLETLMNGHRNRGGGHTNWNKTDIESNSIMSGEPLESLSPRSSIMRRHDNNSNNNQKLATVQKKNQIVLATGVQEQQQPQQAGAKRHQQQEAIKDKEREDEERNQSSRAGNQPDSVQRFPSGLPKGNNLSYATIEVFNRKIILEKERDKLKKEVEMIIIECDKLQQKYKKRDDILDKLFDGRTGNGLENHLEQQLDWLMEQKQYVDQVFYAWKRAETLTSQTCEQFANALELLKRMPKTQDEGERRELAKNICQLLVKSRQDMEQAQRYNPNVDAPFFTDAETQRFDKVIELMQSNSIGQAEYNQTGTVIQFAYKRAVSIRLWLEQILQITIARDSFELAEEYKWIAIQLRKERISLINSKLQNQPYKGMAQSIKEQMLANQQQHLQLLQNARSSAGHHQQLAIQDGATKNERNGNEINRDSGVESDDIDIEEDIYRLLEMNKSRLEAAVAASRQAGVPSVTALDSTGRPVRTDPPSTAASQASTIKRHQLQNNISNRGEILARDAAAAPTSSKQRDEMMRKRIQKRVGSWAQRSVH